jgi:hypothetical protein
MGTLHKVLGGTGTLVVLLAIGWWLWQRPEPEANIRPDVIPPTPSATVPQRTPEQERADVQRAEGMHDCRDGEWQLCLEHLDEAKKLDPAGDTTPEVQTLRQIAHDEWLKSFDVDAGPAPFGKKMQGK